MNETDLQTNPLLDFSGFPRFQEIQTAHIESALDSILKQNRRQIEELLTAATVPDWSNFIMPMEEINDRLERMWTVVSHLHSVKDSEQLRQVYQLCLPKLSAYVTELGQNERLFEKTRDIYHRDRPFVLNQAQRKALENSLRDFHLSGIGLEAAQQGEFRKICSELSQLSNLFSQNLQDATDGWKLHITDQDDLAGLPDSVIAVAVDEARKVDQDGWVFTLQAPCYVPFMTYADSAELRKKMYRAYVTRASDIGPNGGRWDNSEIMKRILMLRTKMARSLGFRCYADYSLATKMASSVNQVENFLQELACQVKSVARDERDELEEFALAEFGCTELNAWDYPWYSEKLKQKKFGFSEEVLRQYFPVPHVLCGLFEIANRLFGIRVEQEPISQVWHPDVRFFRVVDRDETTRGYFFVDLFSREAKQGGAWMTDAVGRRRLQSGLQLPVSFLTCNFSKPVGHGPVLLAHEEVITLFHEFGHGLHHLLSRIDVAEVAGINGVPWDAVELPSQLLENWCWERDALHLLGAHVKTGDRIPDELIEKMNRSKNFQSAMAMLRQIELSLFDLRIHAHTDGCDIQQVADTVRREVAVARRPTFDRYQHGFSHIFTSGYAAGYYSYKWAEVLSADAYSLFEEKGIFDRETGQWFLETILEKGGSEDPMDLFKLFRGRGPTIEALLRHSGIKSNNGGVSGQG